MCPDLPEVQLWKQMKQGDHRAFEVLYRTHYPVLFRFALRLHADRTLAERSIQELFIRLWERRAEVAEVSSPRAYLLTSLRRELMQQKKKDSLFESLAAPTPDAFVYSPQDMCIQEEENVRRKAQLSRALNELPIRQREALYLKYYEELSYAEIAKVMGIQYQSVVNLIFRAFSTLKGSDQLQEYTPCCRSEAELLAPLMCLLISFFY